MVNPSSNSDEGTYDPLTLHMLLLDNPFVPAFETTFKVQIFNGGCATGIGVISGDLTDINF